MNIGHYANALREYLHNTDGRRDDFKLAFDQRHGITDGNIPPELKTAFINESTDYILNRGKELAVNDQKDEAGTTAADRS